jgi:hypothetical protein
MAVIPTWQNVGKLDVRDVAQLMQSSATRASQGLGGLANLATTTGKELRADRVASVLNKAAQVDTGQEVLDNYDNFTDAEKILQQADGYIDNKDIGSIQKAFKTQATNVVDKALYNNTAKFLADPNTTGTLDGALKARDAILNNVQVFGNVASKDAVEKATGNVELLNKLSTGYLTSTVGNDIYEDVFSAVDTVQQATGIPISLDQKGNINMAGLTEAEIQKVSSYLAGHKDLAQQMKSVTKETFIDNYANRLLQEASSKGIPMDKNVAYSQATQYYDTNIAARRQEHVLKQAQLRQQITQQNPEVNTVQTYIEQAKTKAALAQQKLQAYKESVESLHGITEKRSISGMAEIMKEVAKESGKDFGELNGYLGSNNNEVAPRLYSILSSTFEAELATGEKVVIDFAKDTSLNALKIALAQAINPEKDGEGNYDIASDKFKETLAQAILREKAEYMRAEAEYTVYNQSATKLSGILNGFLRNNTVDHKGRHVILNVEEAQQAQFALKQTALQPIDLLAQSDPALQEARAKADKFLEASQKIGKGNPKDDLPEDGKLTNDQRLEEMWRNLSYIY